MSQDTSVSLGRSAAVAAIILILMAAQGWASSRGRADKAAGIDPGYVSALATANRFLHAWQAGDLETGVTLLSDQVRHSRNADALEDFFSAGQDRGFEIMRGSGRARHYRFPVALVTHQGNTVRRVASAIILVRTGKNEWVVDKLP